MAGKDYSLIHGWDALVVHPCNKVILGDRIPVMEEEGFLILNCTARKVRVDMEKLKIVKPFDEPPITEMERKEFR